jgi:Protein kinase domain
LCVLGSVFTDKVIVQRLTDMRWMALSSTEEDNRIYHNARVLIALRKCLKTLEIYYKNLNDSKPTPIVDGKTHPRLYPYPTSFTDHTQKTDVHFKYVRSMEDNGICVTYLAEITDKDGAATGDSVVVKFVASYGEKVHEFLAHRGWAPTLRYCGPLCEETGLSGPAQSAPPGLHLRSNMRMVVMDYIDALPWKKVPNAREQIREVLTALHANGYVFGDLRPPNILFDKDKKVKLIDFDWSGRYDTKDPKNLADGLKKQIDGNMDRAEVGDGPYAHYPLRMSTTQDMWAPGMTPLTPIRPEHDRMMVHKLPYS